MLQFLADITGLTIERPRLAETTAYGAALLAGMATGAEITRNRPEQTRVEPRISEIEREERYSAWRDAVARTLSR
jgi:glycerol kinase